MNQSTKQRLAKRRTSFFRCKRLVAIAFSVLAVSCFGSGRVKAAITAVTASGPTGAPAIITSQTTTINPPAVTEIDVNQRITGMGGPAGGAPGVAWWDLSIKVTANLPVPAGGLLLDFDELTAQNQSGVSWKDFHISLGTGIGGAFASNNMDGLSFDFTVNPQNTSNHFNKQKADASLPEQIWWFDPIGPGVVNNFSTAKFTFRVRVGRIAFDDAQGVPTNMATFTLRQHATITGHVPEPTTLSLLALGGVMLASRRRRCGSFVVVPVSLF